MVRIASSSRWWLLTLVLLVSVLALGATGAYGLHQMRLAASSGGAAVDEGFARLWPLLALATGACVALVLLGLGWALRPWRLAARQMTATLQRLGQDTDLSLRVADQPLAELDALARAINASLQMQQQVTAHIQTLMQGLLGAQPAQTPASLVVHGDWAQTLASVQQGLGQVQALSDELRRIIRAIYQEGADPAAVMRSLSPSWRDHALLKELLAQLLTGNEKLFHTVHDMTQVVERNSTSLAELSWQAKTVSQEMAALASKGAQVAASSQALASNSSKVSADASYVAEMAHKAQDKVMSREVV